jgi:hypothetical protein
VPRKSSLTQTQKDLIRIGSERGDTRRATAKAAGTSVSTVTRLSRIVERTRKAEDFAPPGEPIARAPQRRQPDTLWSLEKIREARDAQMRGDFFHAVRLAEAMRTDDALYTAYLNRIGPQNAVATKLVATGGERGEAVARKAAAACQVPRDVLTGIAGTLANHGIAVGQIIREVKDDGARVDFRLTEWPLEFVKWNPWTEQLETIVRNGGMRVPIVHGDGEWIVFRKFEILPWTQEAAILPASMIWGAHAYALADWAGSSRSHGLAKLFGELPDGVSLQQKLEDGSIVLSDEAQAFLQMMVDVASGDSLAGIRPAGSKVDVPSNTSTMYQVFSELILDRKKAAFFVYLGTDAALGAAGGAPGVDIATLFAVASTKLQGDFEAIEQALNTGLYQVWTAINCGDSKYAPRIEYQIPDPDATAKSKDRGDAYDRLWSALKEARDAQMVVDQAYVNKLCLAFGIEDVPQLAAAGESKVTVQLAPTDVAKVVLGVEARNSQGLPPFGDERDRMTISEIEAASAAKATAPPAPAALTTLAGEFEESKHPRADDGKFGSGGGSHAGNNVSKAAAHHAHAKEELNNWRDLLAHHAKEEGLYQKAFERNGSRYFDPKVEQGHADAKRWAAESRSEVAYREKQVKRTRKRLALAHHARAQSRLDMAKSRAAANPSPEADEDVAAAQRGVNYHAKRLLAK